MLSSSLHPNSRLSPLLPSPSLPDSAEPSRIKIGSLTHVRLNALQSHHHTSPTIQKLKNELNVTQLKIKDSIYYQLKFKESKVIQSIKDNPRFFFSFAKQKSKVKSLIAPSWTQTAPSTLTARAWQTSSSLNTPLSLATLMISTLRHRFSTPSYLSLSLTSPLPQPISRKLLRKSMRTPPMEISISVQKSFVNVEPTYPTPSTLSGRNLLIKARSRFFLPSSRTRSSPLSTRRAAELTRLNVALSPL